RVEFRSVFHAPSRKFKIHVIPNVFIHWNSYKHSFMKKCDGDKLCRKSSFNQFFVYHLRNFKFKPFPTYLPLGSRTRLVSRKNMTVINIAQSRVQS
ncbi:hypothetical protein B296_00035790, partial [Ensete ventricosum]